MIISAANSISYVTFGFGSMDDNFMGAEGAASLAEALKVNSTLQSIRCPKLP